MCKYVDKRLKFKTPSALRVFGHLVFDNRKILGKLLINYSRQSTVVAIIVGYIPLSNNHIHSSKSKDFVKFQTSTFHDLKAKLSENAPVY